MTAYVLVEEREQWGYSASSQDLGIAEVVKVIGKNSSTPAEVYRATFFSILAIEWLEDGRLLIWDAHYDLEESPGVTVVYDPRAGGIVHRLRYPLREEFIFWNEPRTAFYSVIFLGIPCSAYMGGYDFARDRELPAFEPFVEPDQYVRVVGSPVWSEDNTQLLISVSSGTLIGDYLCGDGQIEWNPSSVIMLNLAEEDLQPVLVKGDSDHNYYLQTDSDGQYEIVAEPYVPSYSQCCRGG